MPTHLMLALLLAARCCLGYEFRQPQLEYGPPAQLEVSQYLTQDQHGQYAYGYTAPLYSKHETHTADGVTRGSYSYVDATGQVQRVDYTADAEGFHVNSASNLPKANEDTEEVAALRAQHLAAHEEIKIRLAGGAVAYAAGLPQPVQDTPEVAAAKVAFFKRYEAEKLRNIQQQQQATANALPSRTVLSQPIYVKSTLPSAFIYNFKAATPAPTATAKPSRDYLPAF